MPLNRKQFRDALEKGLGRAVLHARRYGLLGMESEIKRGMRRQLGYDRQLEDGHGRLLWEVVRAAKSEKKFRGDLLKTMRNVREHYVSRQLCELAEGYATAGDVEVKEELYRCFEKGLDHDDVDADEEIIAVDGLDGFLRLAKSIGARARAGTSMPDYAAQVVYYAAREICGSSRVRKMLRRVDPDLAAYRGVLRREESRRSIRKPKRLPWPAFKRQLEELVERNHPEIYGMARRFGKKASRAELSQAFEYLLAQDDPRRLRSVLGVFNVAPIPRYDPKITVLARSGDRRLRMRAIGALARLKHPEVRRLALKSLNSRRLLMSHGLELFRNNYQDKDGAAIFRALSGTWTKEGAHGVVFELPDIVGERPAKSLIPALMKGYELTPCSHCRASIFRRLLAVKMAPGWMVRECLFDSNKNIRALAAKSRTGRRRNA